MSKVKFEKLIEYQGMPVIVTDHARKQAAHRHGMPIEVMKTWFLQAIDMLAHTNFKPKTYNQEVFIYNRAFQRGMIVAFRYDFKSDNHKIALVAVTVYPYGVSLPAHYDTITLYV